jgi:hypothetical protein
LKFFTIANALKCQNTYENFLSPVTEWARFRVTGKLRRYLKERLTLEGCDSRRGWIRAFERWQLLNLCSDDLGVEPLLPYDLNEHNTGIFHLRSDLAKLEGMTEFMASEVITDFIQYSNTISKKFQDLKVKQRIKQYDFEKKLSASTLHPHESLDLDSKYSVSEVNGVVSMILDGYQEKPFSINSALYKKFSRILADNNKPLEIIYCLVARYEALEGV